MRISKTYKCIAGGVLAAALLMTSYSCKKFTELDPLASLSETTAFMTPENIDLTISGMYWQAAVGTYDPLNGTALSNRGYPFGGASIEQGEMRGEDMVNLQAFFQVTYQNTYTPNTANNVNMWEQLYALVNQCNVIIEGVDNAIAKGVISAEVGNAYKGEALFLRALSHHELLLNFSKPYSDNPTSSFGIPYRTKAVTGSQTATELNAQPRGTVAEAYAMLLTDLDLAESYLPTTRASKAISISRATKGAAIALKTRVKLHMLDYDGVINEGKKLGADAASGAFTSSLGSYAIELDPETPFTSNSNNVESIFSIAQSGAANGGTNGALPNMFGASMFKGRDLIAISPNLYNASFWLPSDLRKVKLTVKNTEGTRKYVYVYKYRKISDLSDWNPILRYSEVLLNVSEAYAFKNNNTQSLRLLNAVRDRSVGASNSYGTNIPSDLKKAIYDERRIEFFGEGRRWGDLHRLAQTSYGANGIPAKVLATQLKPESYGVTTLLTPNQAAVPYTNKEFLWPIPQRETDSNETLRGQQNSGW